MRRDVLRTLALASLVIVPLAACGGDDGGDGGGSTPGPTPEGAVLVGALDSLAFDADSYEATAGEVTFVYENEGSLPHTLLVDGISDDEFKLEVGDTDEGSVELDAGEYELYCDVAGHRASGMEATLTVE